MTGGVSIFQAKAYVESFEGNGLTKLQVSALCGFLETMIIAPGSVMGENPDERLAPEKLLEVLARTEEKKKADAKLNLSKEKSSFGCLVCLFTGTFLSYHTTATTAVALDVVFNRNRRIRPTAREVGGPETLDPTISSRSDQSLGSLSAALEDIDLADPTTWDRK